ncbi:phosphatase PAP2/dual specificity phosphatase family protein [Parachitinimonas caeni]|uniref:Phosphatase PAP2/dual specificity phosphatase family protein n=1 Tax=Parachitinimonas caeni TaxID=3031301 RepID=A0ABT7DU14_9NEIS|nr:phosphatase PAP2/dual specificity phosphatase family protein [Parachitinimonas caeni]MDK2123553.1 phosphatase PAP2/dual specificity phosphatase family protein [Parachitinimonas caeni]
MSLPSESWPWRRGLLWLCLLGPFFYLSYGGANWLASQRTNVPSVMFDWERQIPFLAWTILPYWTENLFYAGSLLSCRDRQEVDNLGRRLLTAQLVAVSCFLLFPLAYSQQHPPVSGWPAFFFEALESFDKPFNQAPSLHVALAVILWHHYRSRLTRWLQWPLLAWFVLIASSVLTTWQHHFIDIPTGALLGWFCLWLWPDSGHSPWQQRATGSAGQRHQLAALYLLGACVFAALATHQTGWGWWLLWPALSLLLVAGNYLWMGANGFQKADNGRMSLAARWLFAPYLLGAWINARLWTRRRPHADLVADGVWLGRIPDQQELAQAPYREVIDLCAELPAAAGEVTVTSLPTLDLIPPTPLLLAHAAEAIEAAQSRGPVLVCCALGYSRSAAAICTWLLRSGRASDIDAATRMLRTARPVVLRPAHLNAIATAAKLEIS